MNIVSFSDTSDGSRLWDELVERCDDAWFWHSFSFLEFNLVAGSNLDPNNRSFFIFYQGKAIALVPLVVERSEIGGQEFLDAAYYSGALPWPCLDLKEIRLAGLLPEDVETFAFEELERRARESGAGRIRLRYSPPSYSEKAGCARVSKIILARKYIDSHIDSHCIQLSSATLTLVRERYRRYKRKFSSFFELLVVDGADVTSEIEDRYFYLHVLDAGGQFRSRQSYEKQLDLVRRGQGFLVIAIHLESKEVVGMLLVSLFKNAAYDNSVGVDPQYQELYVSHLLKWRAIEELQGRGAETYELGEKAALPSLSRLYSSKQVGISHFKEGWARDTFKRICCADKFLSKNFLLAELEAKRQGLVNYFNL